MCIPISQMSTLVAADPLKTSLEDAPLFLPSPIITSQQPILNCDSESDFKKEEPYNMSGVFLNLQNGGAT